MVTGKRIPTTRGEPAMAARFSALVLALGLGLNGAAAQTTEQAPATPQPAAPAVQPVAPVPAPAVATPAQPPAVVAPAASAIAVGRAVWLASGGPRMTAVAISPGGDVSVVWYVENGAQFKRETFPLAALVTTDPDDEDEDDEDDEDEDEDDEE